MVLNEIYTDLSIYRGKIVLNLPKLEFLTLKFYLKMVKELTLQKT